MHIHIIFICFIYIRVLSKIPFDKRTATENVWKPLVWRKTFMNNTCKILTILSGYIRQNARGE